MYETLYNIVTPSFGVVSIICNTLLVFFYTLIMVIMPDDHGEVKPENKVSNTLAHVN